MSEEIKKQAKEMEKYLNKMLSLQDDAFAKLPPETYDKVKMYHAETHEMLRGMKKGDFKGIENLLNKYNKPQ